MIRPKQAILIALSVMLLLAVAALTVGYLTSPRAKAASGAASRSGELAGNATDASSANLVPDASSGVIYAVSLTDMDGKPQSLGQWQKKLLVINFWATWCAPCLEEIPIFIKLQKKFAASNMQIIGIAADSRLNVVNFSKKLPINYPLYPDESMAIDFSKRLGNRLGLLPHTVVVAPGGEVIYAKLGVIDESEFGAFLQQHLLK